LQTQNLLGNLTSYTQQYEQLSRSSIIATPDSDQNFHPTPKFIGNDPLPSLNTIVNGTLDAGRVEIVNGWLSGTGAIKGSLNVFGPVSGYDDPIKLEKPKQTPFEKSMNITPAEPDHRFDNPNNKIVGTSGGFLMAGTLGGTPGILTVTSDVSLF